jgi:hypothetical protein
MSSTVTSLTYGIQLYDNHIVKMSSTVTSLTYGE